MSSLIRVAAMHGYSALVAELGGDATRFLTRFHIPTDAEHQDSGFVPFGAFVRLLEASAEDLDCPDFGLRLSARQGLHTLGPLAVIARNAATVLTGMESIARYLYVHSPALRLTERRIEGRIEFALEVAEVGVPYPLQGHELSMGIVVRILRLLGGPEARPGTISFIHAQRGPTTAYDEALGCPVRFGQSWCGFELPVELSERRIENADPETRRIAASYLESTFLPSTASLSVRAAELTRRLLPTGQCSVDAVAAALALHPRTLQRRLALEGTRCQDVIDSERRAQAALYLAEPELPFSHIAALIGYSEQSALNRSCRRWFGKTPKQCRDSGGPIIP